MYLWFSPSLEKNDKIVQTNLNSSSTGVIRNLSNRIHDKFSSVKKKKKGRTAEGKKTRLLLTLNRVRLIDRLQLNCIKFCALPFYDYYGFGCKRKKKTVCNCEKKRCKCTEKLQRRIMRPLTRASLCIVYLALSGNSAFLRGDFFNKITTWVIGFLFVSDLFFFFWSSLPMSLLEIPSHSVLFFIKFFFYTTRFFCYVILLFGKHVRGREKSIILGWIFLFYSFGSVNNFFFHF